MNDEAFAGLVRDYSRLIYTVCRRLVHDDQEAENLTQDTFLTAYRAIGRFQGEHYKPWLGTHRCQQSQGPSQKRRTRPDRARRTRNAGCVPLRLSPAAETESRETVALIRKACEELPEPYRQVALLRFLEDKSYEEIAAALGRPLKTVQTQAFGP